MRSPPDLTNLPSQLTKPKNKRCKRTSHTQDTFHTVPATPFPSDRAQETMQPNAPGGRSKQTSTRSGVKWRRIISPLQNRTIRHSHQIDWSHYPFLKHHRSMCSVADACRWRNAICCIRIIITISSSSIPETDNPKAASWLGVLSYLLCLSVVKWKALLFDCVAFQTSARVSG